MRVRAIIEYLGADFSGWQSQPNAVTVQGVIEEALAVVLRAPCRIAASGRTDAGVHARGQVIAFEVEDDCDLGKLGLSLNALTPETIAVIALEPATADFDPRRHARSRTYTYVITNGRSPSPFLCDRTWSIRSLLDLEQLNRLAVAVVGRHDFSPFRASDCGSSTTVRNVFESSWQRDGYQLVYTVRANAFLKQMVRALVGSMVDVVRGELHESTFLRLLEEGGTRTEAGRSAPSCGLTLEFVDYVSSEVSSEGSAET